MGEGKGRRRRCFGENRTENGAEREVVGEFLGDLLSRVRGSPRQFFPADGLEGENRTENGAGREREIEMMMMMMVPVVQIPIGYTFNPSDEGLIKYYLVPKARGDQPFYASFIPVIDVYATEPWNLGIEFKHGRNRDAFYCFARATRSGASNGRLLRGAGNGTWHASGQRILIYCDGVVVGQKMTNLKFMLPAKKGSKPVATSWIMHEYRLLGSPVDDQGKEMVLCRIQNSGTGVSNDQQLSHVANDCTTSTTNLHQRKRKRDQLHCCGNERTAKMRCNMPSPPCIVGGYDEQQELGMINANGCGTGAYVVADDNQQKQELGMISANSGNSTSTYIIGYDNQLQQDWSMANGNNDSITGTYYVVGDDNQLKQESRMVSTNGGDSTGTYIVRDDDQQQQDLWIGSPNNGSITSTFIVGDYDHYYQQQQQDLWMAGANNGSVTSNFIVGEEYHQQQEDLRMTSVNNGSSTNLYIDGDDDGQQQMLRMPSPNNGVSTNTCIFTSDDQPGQKGVGDGFDSTTTTTTIADDEYAKQLEKILQEDDLVDMTPFY